MPSASDRGSAAAHAEAVVRIFMARTCRQRRPNDAKARGCAQGAASSLVLQEGLTGLTHPTHSPKDLAPSPKRERHGAQTAEQNPSLRVRKAAGRRPAAAGAAAMAPLTQRAHTARSFMDALRRLARADGSGASALLPVHLTPLRRRGARWKRTSTLVRPLCCEHTLRLPASPEAPGSLTRRDVLFRTPHQVLCLALSTMLLPLLQLLAARRAEEERDALGGVSGVRGGRASGRARRAPPVPALPRYMHVMPRRGHGEPEPGCEGWWPAGEEPVESPPPLPPLPSGLDAPAPQEVCFEPVNVTVSASGARAPCRGGTAGRAPYASEGPPAPG